MAKTSSELESALSSRCSSVSWTTKAMQCVERCWKKEMVKTCQLNADRVMVIWEMLNKEIIKTSSELAPSSAVSSLNWFLLDALASLSDELPIFVLALFFFREFCSRPATAEVGLALGQAVYCFLFVNSSKRICVMFIKYFDSFFVGISSIYICCVSKLISHLQKSYTHFLLLIVVWVVLMAVQLYMLGICVGGTAVAERIENLSLCKHCILGKDPIWNNVLLTAIRLNEKYLIAPLSQLNFYEECPYTLQHVNT